jgi:hypothetical protein
VAYVYAPRNPYGYLWGAVFAAPGPPLPINTVIEPDPAQKAAEDENSVLDKIPLPTVEGFTPEKFGQISGEFAKAAQRVRAAENAVAILRAEEWNNRKRREELATLLTELETAIDAWCCRYIDDIPIGTEVDTAEVPGFYQSTAVSRSTQMGIRSPGTLANVSYLERSLNILPTVSTVTGKLNPVDNMTPAQTFHAVAMEPGVVRWKPFWRYGVIIDVTPATHTCTLQLNDGAVRQPRGVTENLMLDADDQQTLTAVPISYPPCDSQVFQSGDEVLVYFASHNRDAPSVIGFRREPIPCPGGRISWGQIS